ncbi:MAG: hypothetical protein KGJ89_00480 [Patescibacteria group bacterium]|nr:hypothetical protein [Patescibacteria group bacterium]MDE2014996.1 hypothetical protein [Patescibacteria group bacterium]MDE2226425.1 hypothetical protein [Patescibacteria group bacterium]
MKKLINYSLILVVATASIAPVFVSAQGRPTTAGNSTGTAAGANFCSALGQRLDNLENKATDMLNQLQGKRSDRESQLQSRWDKYLSNASDREASTSARFAADIQKLDERATSTEQQAAVIAFETAVKTALNTRNTAIRAALQTFRDGVISALKAREDATNKAFTDRINALKAAADKAKTDCANGVSPSTVRQNFVAAVKAAQNNFTAAKKADNTFGSTMKSLTEAKNAAFQKAQSDFRAAVLAARDALKSALGINNSSSTSSSTNE